nr:6-phosphogluconolactonase [Candidatus Gracilibacteria bacterium]
MTNLNISNTSNKIIECINNLYSKEKIFIGLSGGSSLDKIYDNLINSFEKIEKEILEKLFFCFLDERIVPIDNDDSNYKSVYKKFFSKLLEKNLIQKNQIINFDIQKNETIKSYSNRIPKIDIALFGVGEDGHIASLFPNHKLLLNEENNYLEILDSPKAPSHRISISKNMINNINYSFIFFIGEKKKVALEKFLDKKIDYHKLPAKLIKNSKNYFLVTDL